MVDFSEELAGDYFIRDFELRSGTEFIDEFLHKGRNLYEVVRVIDRVPLFLADHLDRLKNSSYRDGSPVDTDTDKISRSLKLLIRAEGITRGNVKIVYHFGEKPGNTFFICYLIPHNYPSPRNYRKGMKAITLMEDRPQPEIKNWRPDFRRRIKKLKAVKNAYEVILINDRGFITEGSQSNVFIIQGNEVLTAPASEVLSGITRKYVFEICRRKGIQLGERSFGLDELANSDAVFLTGTSPKILPLSRVDHFRFSPGNNIVRNIASAYDDLIEDYIKLHPYEP